MTAIRRLADEALHDPRIPIRHALAYLRAADAYTASLMAALDELPPGPARYACRLDPSASEAGVRPSSIPSVDDLLLDLSEEDTLDLDALAEAGL